MASSTVMSLHEAQIRQAYIDGGVDLVRAAAKSYGDIRDRNTDEPEIHVLLDAVVRGLEELIESWPSTVDVIAASAARMASQ